MSAGRDSTARAGRVTRGSGRSGNKTPAALSSRTNSRRSRRAKRNAHLPHPRCPATAFGTGTAGRGHGWRSPQPSATGGPQRGLGAASGRDPAAGASPALHPPPQLCRDARPLRPGLPPRAPRPPHRSSPPRRGPPAPPGHPAACTRRLPRSPPAAAGRPHLSRTLPRLPARCARSRQPLPGAARSSSSLSLRSSGSARRLRGRDPAVLRTGSDIAPLLPPQRPRTTARSGRRSRPEGRAQRSRTGRPGPVQHSAPQVRPGPVPQGPVPRGAARRTSGPARPGAAGPGPRGAPQARQGCWRARRQVSRPRLRGASPCPRPGGPWLFGRGSSLLGPGVRAPAPLTA